MTQLTNNKNNVNFFNEHCSQYSFIPTVFPKTRRIIAIGDIHGDLKLCVKLLKISKVIDNNLNWIGGDTIVVQVGDQIDRCRPVNGMGCYNKNATMNDEHSDIKILKLFTKLNQQAQQSIPPGRVISLLGNHELMNVQGVMNYVSYEGLHKFANYKDPYNPNIKFDSGLSARKYSFAPGNEYAKFLGCTRLGSVIIGSNLFVHAGIIDHFVDEIQIKKSSDLENINLKIQKWLFGLIEEDKINDIINGNTSMFWNRILGNLPQNISMSNPACSDNISKVLQIFDINSLIIGHTPQSFLSNDGINGTCSNKVWRVDNGASHAFNIFDNNFLKTGVISKNRKPQVLEIINDDQFNVLVYE